MKINIISQPKIKDFAILKEFVITKFVILNFSVIRNSKIRN